MKPRVFELIGSFVSGGSERQGLQLSRLLAEDGEFDIYVGCLERSGPLLQENTWLSPDQIPEFKLSSFYDANFITQVYRCAAYLRKNRISVINTHDFYTNIFGMLSAYIARVPVRIASKRETYSKSDRQTRVERQSFRFAQQVVCNAEAVRDFLIDTGVPSSKTTVIHNGLNLEKFSDEPFRREDAYRKHGISPSAAGVVTMVANLRSGVKNHSMFLRSAAAVVNAFPSAEFVIAGEGELEGSLREQAKSLNIAEQVRFVGTCSDVPGLLSVSDVCVLSSRSEGFSNAILEYMAAAKPVVATRVGGAAEAVVEGETGFLVESDDDRMMSQRIVGLLKDPTRARAFGERGRARVEKMFSLNAQVNNTKHVYNKFLGKGTKAR